MWGNLEALNLLDMVAKEEAAVVSIHVQEQMINQKQIHCRWISKSKHLNALTRQWYVLLWESSFHMWCVLRLFMECRINRAPHSEKRRIPFAFDRSLLWGSMNYSLTQSGEQKTSSGADWPHAEISMCICGKRWGNIISLLVLDTYIGDMLGNTSISWSYFTFHVAAIVTSYLQTFWCDDLKACKKDQKKNTCTSTDMIWHLTFGVQRSLGKNTKRPPETLHSKSLLHAAQIGLGSWGWSRKSPNFDSKKLVSFF